MTRKELIGIEDMIARYIKNEQTKRALVAENSNLYAAMLQIAMEQGMFACLSLNVKRFGELIQHSLIED